MSGHPAILHGCIEPSDPVWTKGSQMTLYELIQAAEQKLALLVAANPDRRELATAHRKINEAKRLIPIEHRG